MHYLFLRRAAFLRFLGAAFRFFAGLRFAALRRLRAAIDITSFRVEIIFQNEIVLKNGIHLYYTMKLFCQQLFCNQNC